MFLDIVGEVACNTMTLGMVGKRVCNTTKSLAVLELSVVIPKVSMIACKIWVFVRPS